MEQKMTSLAEQLLTKIHPSWLKKSKVLLFLASIMLIIECLVGYNEYFKKIEVNTIGLWFILVILGYAFFFMAWSGLWALAGKSVSNNAQFVWHLNVAVFSNLLWTISSTILFLLGFSLNIERLLFWAWHVIFWTIVFWALSGHLKMVVRATLRKQMAVSLLIVLCLSGVSGIFVKLVSKREPAYFTKSISVLPQFFLLANPVTNKEHLIDLSELQTKADYRARKDVDLLN